MRYLQQMDESDCGAACLAMIASHYKLKKSITSIREIAGYLWEIFMKKFYFILLAIVFMSCTNNIEPNINENIEYNKTNITRTYSFIHNQAFIGGSVIFDGNDIKNGHLQKDVKLLVRLGTIISSNNSVIDYEPEAIYGYLYIIDVNEKCVNFSMNKVNQDNTIISKIYTVLLGQSVDINNDNFPDLIYEKPSNRVQDNDNIRFLTFLSSMEERKTNMFCILPNEYKNNEYPNGIMGVNTKGNYIVTKYNVSNNSRSIVSELQKGDYVLDNVTGKYQRVTTNLISCRAIQDEDVTDIQKEIIFFEESDFYSQEDIEAFILQLKTSRLISNNGGIDNIEILNNLLKDKSLISRAIQLNLLIEEDIDINYIDEKMQEFDSNMLAYVNRSFLSYLFPNYCSEKETTAITEIFPLLVCNIGNIEETVYYSEGERSIASKTFDNYSKERNMINEEYKKYFNLPFGLDKKTVFSAKGNISQAKITNWDFKIGIQGKIENEWGNKIGMDIALVVYANIETELMLNKKIIKESLIGGAKNLCKLSLPINLGLVRLTIDFPLNFDLLFSISGDCLFPTPVFGGITGLFGIEAGCGLNYSVAWKKILFIPYPSLSCETYASSKLIHKVTSYVGLSSENPNDLIMPEKASLCFSLSPQFGFGTIVSALDCVSIGVTGSLGTEGRFVISSLNNPIQLANNKQLPITSKVGFYIVPTAINGTCKLHLPEILDTLFHKEWERNFPINNYGTEIKVWEKKLF